jgi:hypothetical protein
MKGLPSRLWLVPLMGIAGVGCTAAVPPGPASKPAPWEEPTQPIDVTVEVTDTAAVAEPFRRPRNRPINQRENPWTDIDAGCRCSSC